MNSVQVSHASRNVSGQFRLPASKSLSNRAQVLNFLAEAPAPIRGLSEADDTRLLEQHLATIHRSAGRSGLTELHCQNAGTVFRFLTSVLAITPGTWLLTGSPRMLERPIGILTEALKDLGADIQYLGKRGYPPLQISGKEIAGGTLVVNAGISSQFISSLLMTSSRFSQGLTLQLTGKVSSRPYIDMTVALMEKAGIPITTKGNTHHVSPKIPLLQGYQVEPDWSSAAFIYEIAAFARGANILIPGLQKESLQGDAVLPELYSAFGIVSTFKKEGLLLTRSGSTVQEYDHDFSDHPDLAQPVIATCAGLGIQGRFTGLESLRIKETDRLAAMQSELAKMGIITHVENNADFMLEGSGSAEPFAGVINLPPIHTHDDHRMAMAFAPFALLVPAIRIENPAVVSKSFPGYWDELMAAGFKIG